MRPVELRAYQLRLENSNGLDLSDTLRQIVVLGDFPNELVPAVIQCLEDGKCILQETLCDILILTKSEDLYRLVESRDLLKGWELVRLFENGFPLEEALCKALYACFRDNPQPFRRAIVNAMAEHGGRASLELLEVIEYELSDCRNVPEATREDLLQRLELRNAKSFLRDVETAIDKIKLRIQTP